MALTIQTPFDGTIDESVQLEQVSGSGLNPEEILGNAENVYKSFLYLRKMYSIYPQKTQTVSAFTGESSSDTALNIPLNVNKLVVKNYDTDNNLSLKFSSNEEYLIFPGQTEEISITANTEEETNTNITYNGKISVRFVIGQDY